MNLVELLMAEHASLRVYFRHLRYLNSDFLFELDDFVTSCHTRVEGEILFPEIRTAATIIEREAVETRTKRLEEEHQLLQMLGEKMRILVAEGAGTSTGARWPSISIRWSLTTQAKRHADLPEMEFSVRRKGQRSSFPGLENPPRLRS